MNPVIIILALLGATILWFLLSFTFIPLGKLIYQIVKDVIDVMNKEDNKEKEKKK